MTQGLCPPPAPHLCRVVRPGPPNATEIADLNGSTTKQAIKCLAVFDGRFAEQECHFFEGSGDHGPRASSTSFAHMEKDRSTNQGLQCFNTHAKTRVINWAMFRLRSPPLIVLTDWVGWPPLKLGLGLGNLRNARKVLHSQAILKHMQRFEGMPLYLCMWLAPFR